MKIKAYICALALLLSAPLLQGQGQVSTRKHRLADFTDKVTQVVLTGNEMLSSALREEVVADANAARAVNLEHLRERRDRTRIGIGLITFSVINLTSGKGSKQYALTYVLALIFLVKFFLVA